MNLKKLDLYRLSQLASTQVDHVTCLECCKYYIAPETAICGHNLCHGCWRGRRTCPSCSAPLQRRDLKLNLPMQNLTEHVHILVEAFEKLFNIKLDDFNLDGAINEVHCDADPTKNVKDWLASSQNQFSAPTINSEPIFNDISPVELSTSKIQVHTNSKKSKSPQKVIYVPPPQDDWDKIEKLPDTEESCFNNKENLIYQTNKQPYLFEDEYSTDNPRRSSRKREHNVQHENTSKIEVAEKVPSSKNSNSETEKKSNKAKQNWNNVKRMRKEFSKLNKKNRNKLNVSIEMCKKTQSKANIEPDQLKLINKDSQPATYTIEDNTPDINVNNNIDQHVESAKSLQNDFTPFSNNRDVDVVMTSAELITEKVPSDINKTKAQMYHVIDENKNNDTKNIVSEEGLAKNIYESVNKENPLTNKNELCPHCSEKNSDLEDIEITFKIGTMVTNITVKRKNNDVQLKVKADRGVQASLGTNTHVDKDNHCLITQNIDPQEVQINLGNKNTSSEYENILNKSMCTKKNTASADTATVQFEITESVEKDLSNVMDCADSKPNNKKTDISKIQTDETPGQDSSYDQYINDFDIFENESVIEQHVHLFNKSKQAPSEILMPTVKTKSQKHPNKRVRDDNDDEELNAKKIKIVSDKIEEVKKTDSTLQPCQDSESTDYDAVIGQVFASIDADIGKTQQNTKNKQTTNITNDDSKVMKSQYTEKIFQSQAKKDKFTPTLKSTKAYVNDKYSENIFSFLDKDNESVKENHEDVSTRRHIENLLTPGMCQDLISTNEVNMELINKEQCTPLPDNEDSDKSVVEETPQKNVSFPKPKNITDVSKISKGNPGTPKEASSSQLVKSIINVSDTLVDTTKITKEMIDQDPVSKKTLETPLTINKFVDHIKHKSTPVARKSLNFDSENVDDIDPEQTLCPSTAAAAKVTQNKELATKAIQQTPKSPVKKPLLKRHVKELSLKHCMAGSCLSNVELTNLQYLCVKYDWKYVDKYTNELTHLVVGVDEENRSQRSVKYMCALAASKWIISYEWVEACIKTNLIVGESLYEVLDGTGEPGPRRSRLASPKLFDGITFYCMPPFSVLDINILKEMLVAAGGRVAGDARAVRAAADAPALLLAEPEHTQEDRFVYLALELGIVPVNYEWVLNCLGAYALSSVRDQLLCPAALLPPATSKWPDVLISPDSDSD